MLTGIVFISDEAAAADMFAMPSEIDDMRDEDVVG